MRKLIYAFFVLLLIVASIGLVRVTFVNMEEYNHIQTTLTYLKDKHTELNINILRTNLKLNQNYDPLILLQYEINQAYQQLEEVDISADFSDRLQILIQVSKEKFDLLEQFKADHAILQNAENTLPDLVKPLMNDLKLSIAIREELHLLITNILQYHLLASLPLEQKITTSLQKLQLSSSEIPQKQLTAFNRTLKHSENLIDKLKKLASQSQDLYSSKIHYELVTLHQTFDVLYKEKIMQGKLLGYSLITLIVALLAVLFFIARRMVRAQYSLTRSNFKLNNALKELTSIQEEVEKSNYLLSRQNENIVSSLRYGKRIQQIHLPSAKELARCFPKHFIYYQPKDLVSGDFYWLSDRDDQLFLAVADATGHGVPGAMLSIMGIRLLDGIVQQQSDIHEPGEILTLLDEQMKQALKQQDTNNKDGMDISLLMFDRRTNILSFSGAKGNLLYIQQNEAKRIRGNRFSIGGVHSKVKQFDNISIPIKEDVPTMLYLYSDGFQDQFGGERWRKYGAKQFRDFLISIHHLPVIEQDDAIRQELAKWKGVGTQTDDILVLGIQLEV